MENNIPEEIDIADLLDEKIKELKKLRNDNSSKEEAIKKLEDKYSEKIETEKRKKEEAIKKIEEKFSEKLDSLKEELKTEKEALNKEIKEKSKLEKNLGDQIISIIKGNQTGIKKSKVVKKVEKEDKDEKENISNIKEEN